MADPEAGAPESERSEADRTEAAETVIRVAPSGEPVVVRPPRRRNVDAVLLLVGGLVLAVTWRMAAGGAVSDLEASIFRSINTLPAVVYPVVVVPMQLGSLAAVPVFSILAALGRRFWMATAMGAAGLTAYAVARGVKIAVDRGRPLVELPNVVVHGPKAYGGGFPSGHSAVSAALVLAALPYLMWRWRYTLLALPPVVAFARLYVGAHLPLDVVGGLAIGLMAASAVHLTIGRPTMRAEDVPPEPSTGPDAPGPAPPLTPAGT